MCPRFSAWGELFASVTAFSAATSSRVPVRFDRSNEPDPPSQKVVPQFFPFMAWQKYGRDEHKENKHQQNEKDKHEGGREEIHVA